MNYTKWLEANTSSLKNKTVALTGSTGGIGSMLCRHLAGLGADLVLIDRNQNKSAQLQSELEAEYPCVKITRLQADLEDMASVKAVCDELMGMQANYFIHNAGAYSIPRHKCSTGYDNVFQINFISPYYMIMRLLPQLREAKGAVAVVGSIAHNYSKIDEDDIDFSTREASSLVYGNAKRYLMYSLNEVFKEEKDVGFAIVHPGITFTNITAHYPKLIFAVIKHPMKVIFMKPKKAALCIVKGLFEHCGYDEWIGPWLFDVWGLPKKKRLVTASKDEKAAIDDIAREIYSGL